MKVPFKVKRVIAIAFVLMGSMAWLSCSDWEAVKVIKQPSPNRSTDSLPSCEEIDISGSMQGVDFFKLFAGKKNIVFMDGDDTIGMVLNMGENTHYIYKEKEIEVKTVTYTSKDNMGVVVVSAKNAIITAYTPKLEGVYIAMFNKSNNEDADKIKEKRDVSGTEEEKLHLSGYWFNGDNTVFKMKPKANAKFSPCKETNTSSVSIPGLLDMVYTSPGTNPNPLSDSSSASSSNDASPAGDHVPSWGTKRWVQNEDQNRMMEILLGVSNDYIALPQDADITSYPSGVVNGQFYCYTNPSNSQKKFYVISEMMYEFIGPHSWPGINSIAKVGQVYVYDNPYTGSTDYVVAKKRINTDWFPINQTSNSSWEYVTSVYPGGQTEAEYLLVYDLLSGKNTKYRAVEQRSIVNIVKDSIYQIIDNSVPYKKFFKALKTSPWWNGAYVMLDDHENFKFLGPYAWPGKDVSGVRNGIYVSVNETSGRLDYWKLRKVRNTDWYPTDKLNNSSWAYVGTENSQFLTVDPISSKIADYVVLKEKATPMSSTNSGWYSPGAVYYTWAQDRNGVWYRKYYQVVSGANSSYVYKFMGPMMLHDLITTDFSPNLRGQVGSVFRRYNTLTKKAAYFKLRVSNITQGIPMDKSNNDTWEYIGEEDDIRTVTFKEYTVTGNYIPHEAGWTWNGFIATMESINATNSINFIRSVQTDWDISGTIETKQNAFKKRLKAIYSSPEPNTIYTFVCWSPPASNLAGLAAGGMYRFDALQYHLRFGDFAYNPDEFPSVTYQTIAIIAVYMNGAHEIGHVLGAVHTYTEYVGDAIPSYGGKGGNTYFWTYYNDVMYPQASSLERNILLVHKSDENIAAIRRLLGITK